MRFRKDERQKLWKLIAARILAPTVEVHPQWPPLWGKFCCRSSINSRKHTKANTALILFLFSRKWKKSIVFGWHATNMGGLRRYVSRGDRFSWSMLSHPRTEAQANTNFDPFKPITFSAYLNENKLAYNPADLDWGERLFWPIPF